MSKFLHDDNDADADDARAKTIPRRFLRKQSSLKWQESVPVTFVLFLCVNVFFLI